MAPEFPEAGLYAGHFEIILLLVKTLKESPALGINSFWQCPDKFLFSRFCRGCAGYEG